MAYQPLRRFVEPPRTDAKLRLEEAEGYKPLDYERVRAMSISLVHCALGSVPAEFGIGGVLVPLSGGADSSTVAAICDTATRIHGKARTLAVTIGLDPQNGMEQEDIQSAEWLCDALGIEHRYVDGSRMLGELRRIAGFENELAYADSVARVRNTITRSLADEEGLLVAGTSDRSENAVRGFASGLEQPHFSFVRSLYKTEVVALGRHAGVPEPILRREPAGSEMRRTEAGLYGAGYEEGLDAVLYLFLEKGKTPGEISSEYGIDREWLGRMRGRMEGHKWRVRPLGFEREQFYQSE